MCGTSKSWCDHKDTNGIASIKRDGRGCTDILGLLAFLASWGLVAGLLYICFESGADYRRVIHPVDVYGNICGVDNMKDKPLGALVYPWNVDAHKTLICLDDCAKTQSIRTRSLSALYPSKEVMYYCVPTPFTNLSINIDISGNFNPQLMEAAEATSRAAADVYTTRMLIGGSLGLAVVVAFMFSGLLRACAKTMVYSLLIVIMLFGMMLAQLLLLHAKDAEVAGSYDPTTIEYLEYAGYTLMGLVGVFAIVVFFLRNQIDIAIEVTKEASRAVLDMKCIVLFPIIPSAMAIVYFLAWGYIAANIYSLADQENFEVDPEIRQYQSATWLYYAAESGNATALREIAAMIKTTNANIPTAVAEFVISDNIRNYMFAHIFHFFWTTQFIFYFGYLTFAGAAADWYFTPSDAHGRKKRGADADAFDNSPVLSSCLRTFKHHMGTVAICSFIIAVVKTLRAIITYVEHKTKGEPPNQLQKAVFCAIQCYLKCLECCLDKINKYALVWTAVYGDGFLTAACSSFQLVWRNLFRVAAINTVSAIIFLMGKIGIALFTAGIIAGVLEFAGESIFDQIVSPLAPCLMVFVASYSVATMFFTIFSSVIDTLFLCFLIDSEVNDKGNMMASKALQKLVGKYSKESEKHAVQHKSTRELRGSQVGDFAKLQQAQADQEMGELSS